MILGSLPCLCLDLHAYVFFAMFLCLDLCVYVLRIMLVCLDLCWLLCHVLLFLSPDISLSCFLALSIGCRSRSRGLGLHSYTKAYIKGFGSFPLCISMFACLLLCFIYILASLDLGFAKLWALCGLMFVWLHWSLLRLIGCNHLRDIPLWCWCSWFTSSSASCDVDMFALLALHHPFGFLCIFARLPTCLCMSLCVVCTPIQWNYGHSIQTYICPPSTSLFVW